MKCDQHPWYKGTRKAPSRDCKVCWEIYYSHHEEERPHMVIPEVDSPIPPEMPPKASLDMKAHQAPFSETYVYNRFNGPLPCRVEGGEEVTLKPGEIKALNPGDVLDKNTSRLVRRELLVIIVREV